MSQCQNHVDSGSIVTHLAPSPWSEVNGFLVFCIQAEIPSGEAPNDWQGISKRLEHRFGVLPSSPQWDEARGCFVISLRPYRWLPQLLKEWGDPHVLSMRIGGTNGTTSAPIAIGDSMPTKSVFVRTEASFRLEKSSLLSKQNEAPTSCLRTCTRPVLTYLVLTCPVLIRSTVRCPTMPGRFIDAIE